MVESPHNICAVTNVITTTLSASRSYHHVRGASHVTPQLVACALGHLHFTLQQSQHADRYQEIHHVREALNVLRAATLPAH